MDLLKRTIFREDKRIDLHAREFALLEYLMRNPGRVISKTMIIEHVWNYDFDPQTNIVETCICRLRNKLNDGFAEDLVRTVRGAGYVLDE
jgi:DNA-binding response OmpR family regulator